jgi:hypothetical protein
MTKCAIKNIKTGSFYTENKKNKGIWTKDIMKAMLCNEKDAEWYIKNYPNAFKNCKPVPIQETYLREEV